MQRGTTTNESSWSKKARALKRVFFPWATVAEQDKVILDLYQTLLQTRLMLITVQSDYIVLATAWKSHFAGQAIPKSIKQEEEKPKVH